LSFPTVLKNHDKEHEIILEYGAITLYGASFQSASFNNSPFCSPSTNIIHSPTIWEINNALEVTTLQPESATPRYTRVEFSIFNSKFSMNFQILNFQLRKNLIDN